MSGIQSQYEKTSADKTKLGFEYQFYFFLLQLLGMKKNESVSWEVEDDVCFESSNGVKYLFQIKHTVQKKADGTPKNLTTLDIDLWKTLALWIDKILAHEENERAIFLSKTYFVLASNKSKLQTGFDSIIDAFNAGKIGKNDFQNELKKLSKRTQSKDSQEYIKKCLNLNDEIFTTFFTHVSFELEIDDIIQKCKDTIESHHIHPDKLDSCFNILYSQIRNDNFIKISDSEKVKITFDDFTRKYRKIFDKIRSSKLIIDKSEVKIASKLEDQIFIKQLIDINDTKEDDTEQLIEFTRFKLCLENNLSIWLQNGDITNDEKDDFENKCITYWKNEHRRQSRPSSLSLEEIGRTIIDNLREKIIMIQEQNLDIEMSNGSFYYLADIPKIGFLKDWETRYAKK